MLTTINQLNELSNPYLHAATSDNTRKAYQSDISHFTSWGGILPCSSDILISYLQDQAPLLNPRTLIRRLTAIKHWHTYQNKSDPTVHPLVRKTLKGIQRLYGTPKQKAPALTAEQLLSMSQYMQSQDSLAMLRNNAILQIGFFGAFRVSELVSIKIEHITFSSDGIEILIPRSKTDQTGQGQTCAIPYGDDNLCPVRALQSWIQRAGISSHYIFRDIDRHENIGNRSLNSKSISSIIKTIATKSGLPSPHLYSSHSLRRGFATAASRKGASFVSIMRQGRWKHEGTVLGYIEEGQRFEQNAVNTILGK